MQAPSYSLTQREDGIYVIFFPDSSRAVIDLHFEHMAKLLQSHSGDEHLYILIDGRSTDRLPSISYISNKLRDCYKAYPTKNAPYVAYMYPRHDVIFNIFKNLLSAMRLNATRRLFATEEEAVAWLLRQREENSAGVQSTT